MNLIVDTSVWSLVLRRKKVDESQTYVVLFRQHIEKGDTIHLVGNILQELLDGVSHSQDFEKLNKILEPFPLIPLSREMYVLASQLRNTCRKHGVQAGPIDFLIASTCLSTGYPLLTTDQDFTWIAKHCDLMVLQA